MVRSKNNNSNEIANEGVSNLVRSKLKLYALYNKVNFKTTDVQATDPIDPVTHLKKHKSLIKTMKENSGRGIMLLDKDMPEILKQLGEAKKNILIFSINIGPEFIEKLINIKTQKSEVTIVLVFWAWCVNQQLIDRVANIGINLIQIEQGCQHIKTIIIDDKIITLLLF